MGGICLQLFSCAMLRLSFNSWCWLALALRLIMMAYGQWQDHTMAVKYTDVDYFVFSDAAKFVLEGKSPYLRSTYRYPPVIAWLATLNHTLSPLTGKFIFVLFDIMVGRLIYKIVKKMGNSEVTARKCSLAWLLNPLPAAVSTRGNAESVIAAMVLQSLDFLISGRIVSAAVCYGLAVHLKIYPVTYALSIYLYLASHNVALRKKSKQNTMSKKCGNAAEFSLLEMWERVSPSRQCLQFVCVSVLVLALVTGVCYSLYGWEFLYETYLYHVVRGDVRHNFSPYFYLLYLMSDPSHGLPLWLRLMLFLPQVALLSAIGWRYQQHPAMAWFLSTFCFVMTNKVCTSQYFLWYLSILPVIIPHLKMSAKKATVVVCIWFLAQGIWLFPAYLLEFQGQNTFLLIWAAGLLFFCVNGYIATAVVDNYR